MAQVLAPLALLGVHLLRELLIRLRDLRVQFAIYLQRYSLANDHRRDCLR